MHARAAAAGTSSAAVQCGLHVRTSLANGNRRNSKSVLRWYCRISRSARVPGRARCFTPCAARAGALALRAAAFTALRGALDLRIFSWLCFVRAMLHCARASPAGGGGSNCAGARAARHSCCPMGNALRVWAANRRFSLRVSATAPQPAALQNAALPVASAQQHSCVTITPALLRPAEECCCARRKRRLRRAGRLPGGITTCRSPSAW